MSESPAARLAADVGGHGHEYLLNREPLDLHAEDVAGLLERVRGRLAELDAASLSATASMHLGLDHHGRAEPLGNCFGLVRGGRHFTRRDRHTSRPQQVFCLKLV
mgnify:CR=1 FL=1